MPENLKNRIIGPMDFMIPGFQWHGMNLPVVADLPEGGFLQIVSGENPMVPATPSVTMPKGCMVVLLEPAISEQIRPLLRQLEKDAVKALANPSGAILHPTDPNLTH